MKFTTKTALSLALLLGMNVQVAAITVSLPLPDQELRQEVQGKVNCSDRTQSPPPGCPRRDT